MRAGLGRSGIQSLDGPRGRGDGCTAGACILRRRRLQAGGLQRNDFVVPGDDPRRQVGHPRDAGSEDCPVDRDARCLAVRSPRGTEDFAGPRAARLVATHGPRCSHLCWSMSCVLAGKGLNPGAGWSLSAATYSGGALC